MNKKTICLILMFLAFEFCVFLNLIQNTLFLKKDILLKSAEIEAVCENKNKICKFLIKETPEKNLEKEVWVDIYENVILINVLKMAGFLFLLIFFYIFVKISISKEDTGNYSFKDVLVLSFLGIYKIVFLFFVNIVKIPFFIGFSLIFCALILFLILYYLFKKILKDSFFAFVFSCSTFYFVLDKTIYNFLDNLFDSNYFVFDNFIFAEIVLILLSLTLLLKKTKLKVFLKQFSIILLILCLANSALKIFENCFRKNEKTDLVYFDKTNPIKQDIFFILLDMYTGEKTLKEQGFDNNDFYGALNTKGFKVLKNIDSNYNKTAASLQSFLNFDYLENLPPLSVASGISNSRTFQIAKLLNYKVFYHNPWLEEVQIGGQYIDGVFAESELRNFNSISFLLSNTIFSNAAKAYSKQLRKNQMGDEFINSIILDKNKKLCFLHFMMPHYPYLYDENGNNIKDFQDFELPLGERIMNIKSYLSYVKYTNKYSLNLIDKILENSKDPIIVVFGDHGIRKRYFFLNEQSKMDELRQDKTYIDSTFNTFLAYYNKNSNMENFENTKTLVNFFINFSNENFKTELKPLEDKRYYVYHDFNAWGSNEIKGFYVK